MKIIRDIREDGKIQRVDAVGEVRRVEMIEEVEKGDKLSIESKAKDIGKSEGRVRGIRKDRNRYKRRGKSGEIFFSFFFFLLDQMDLRSGDELSHQNHPGAAPDYHSSYR